MITPVVMPQLGLEVTEGTVAALHVTVGASVAEGELLLELETDKALTEVVAPRAGVIVRVDAELGDTVTVGATLILLADEPHEVLDEELAHAAHGSDSATSRRWGFNEYGRRRSAPVARRAARELGIELATIEGTGPRGRITLADVKRVAADRGPDREHRVNGNAEEPIAMSATRRAIARRMTRSQTIPQFSLQRDLDATRLLADKEALPSAAPGEPKRTLNDMLVQALAEVVLRHPEVRSSYVEDDQGEPMLSRRTGGDVGLAVATDRGLMVPVIREPAERSLREIAAQRARLVAAARSGRLTVEEMSRATITLSNLGAFGVERFVAMLNPGEAAILAVGRTVPRAVPRGCGIAIVPTLSMTLTVDHRVIDGAGGAQILATLVELLEGAMTWRP